MHQERGLCHIALKDAPLEDLGRAIDTVAPDALLRAVFMQTDVQRAVSR